MKLRLSMRAIKDIDRIYAESLKTFGPKQADAYQMGLKESLGIVAQYPEAAPVQTEFKQSLRLRFYGAHVVAYIVHADEVLVVRVLHAHRNLSKIL